MTFERHEHQALLEGKMRDRVEQIRPELRRIVQASVAAEHLTGTPEWEYFLSLVQGMIEEQVGIRNAADALFGEDRFRAAEEILEVRHSRAMAQARIDALESVLLIPKQAIEEGQKAKKVLEA